MKINILNSNFTSLSCAVAYKIYKFIPSQNDSEKIQENWEPPFKRKNTPIVAAFKISKKGQLC